MNLKLKKIRIAFAAILSLSLLITGCGDKKVWETYDSVANDPLNARIYTLKNGLKVYITVYKDEPRIQTLIAVRAGSKYDPPTATGLAHYLEHMLFKGTSKIASVDWENEKKLLDQIEQLYEKNRATTDPDERKNIYAQIDSLSGIAVDLAAPNEYDKMISSIGAKYTNAWTSDEQTVYVNNIPSNELEKWLKIESERFGELVLRLFHTELETVYEEFNRGQDSDFRKVYRAMREGLFAKHPYGTQTTIGTGEHLKNPSMIKIHEYFVTYYVPNNMAICLSGDLNPDSTVALIDKYFGSFVSKQVPQFTFEPQPNITEPLVKDVYGPEAESVSIGFRFDGIKSDDVKYIELIDVILNNGQAGLMDLNLIQKQKLLAAYSYADPMIDYSIHAFIGRPREGQPLEKVKELLLEQIEKIKNGEFDEWLVEAAINDKRLSQIQNYEHNFPRAIAFVEAFTNFVDWKDYVTGIDKMAQITKEQIVEFAKANYKDNYVVVNKRTGEDTTVVRIEKPTITPLDLNRENQSAFFKDLSKVTSDKLKPAFVDFEKDISRFALQGSEAAGGSEQSGDPGLSGIEVNYIENKLNDRFELYYILDMGTNYDKVLGLAVNYLPYLGTEKYTASELQEEFYRLGLSFDVFTSSDRVYVSLEGLERSMEEGVKLFEHLLSNVLADNKALDELITDILKKRADAKLNKWLILYRAMYNYAVYGKRSSFTYILSEEELRSVKPGILIEKLKKLTSYYHRIFYYGQNKPETVLSVLNKHHQVPDQLNDYPEPEEYVQLPTEKDQVLFVDYDMVQAHILMISKDVLFDKELVPMGKLFNEYFGSGLSSIVFQEIREAKAYAYSARASYTTPRYPDKAHYVQFFVGTQADKLKESLGAMQKIMENMPEAYQQFEAARKGVTKKIESERITKTSIFWTYENAVRKGLDYDIRKDVYVGMRKIKLHHLRNFFDQHIKGKKYTYLILAKKKDIDLEVLKAIGAYEELTLEEIFNY
ncbi:MAG: insulinase family protein [Cytophagales bacterium]|nr:insulinase family protein [Cytophagales bacterium]